MMQLVYTGKDSRVNSGLLSWINNHNGQGSCIMGASHTLLFTVVLIANTEPPSLLRFPCNVSSVVDIGCIQTLQQTTVKHSGLLFYLNAGNPISSGPLDGNKLGWLVPGLWIIACSYCGVLWYLNAQESPFCSVALSHGCRTAENPCSFCCGCRNRSLPSSQPSTMPTPQITLISEQRWGPWIPSKTCISFVTENQEWLLPHY